MQLVNHRAKPQAYVFQTPQSNHFHDGAPARAIKWNIKEEKLVLGRGGKSGGGLGEPAGLVTVETTRVEDSRQGGENSGKGRRRS